MARRRHPGERVAHGNDVAGAAGAGPGADAGRCGHGRFVGTGGQFTGDDFCTGGDDFGGDFSGDTAEQPADGLGDPDDAAGAAAGLCAERQ